LPVAVNCCVFPAEIETEAGATVMEVKVTGAAVTVSAAPALVTLPCFAVMVALPAATPVARPVALTEASASEAPQVRPVVRVCVVPSLKWPVAANCCVLPTVTEAVDGLRVIELRVTGAAVTVRTTPALTTLPCATVIVAGPAATPAARPVALTVASALDELQVKPVVRACVLPSLKWPVAENCWVLPTTTDADVGLRVIEVRVAGRAATVSAAALLIIVPCDAEMVAVPGAMPVATPVALTEASALELLHVNPELRACVLPSLKWPDAANCSVLPTVTEAVVGLTEMDCNVGGGGEPDPEPVPVPDPEPEPVPEPIPFPNSRTLRN